MAKSRKGGSKKHVGRGRDAPVHEANVVTQWKDYFGKGNLQDWQGLCEDLGIDGDLPSKNACRRALKQVWVNIPDFLSAKHKPDDVEFFASQRELAAYTSRTRKTYPKNRIEKGSPLRALLAHIF